MRRKSRSTKMKNELGQSVDHFRRAATIAAQETSATVGPKFYAARDRVQPAAVKAKGAATGSWDNALAALAPLVAAATSNARQASKETAKMSRKNARKLEKRANKAMGRKQRGRRGGRLVGLALVGAAVGAGAAYVVRRKKTAQWDEYDPSRPITSTEPVSGADDAAFEPSDYTAPSGTVTDKNPTVTDKNPTVTDKNPTVTDKDPTVTDTSPLVPGDTADQTSSAQHSPKVARMASGQNGTTKD
jgi:hypothetical protein